MVRVIYKSGYIYKIENVKTGDFYIGSTIDIKNRFKSHKGLLKKNKHYNSYLQSSYNKYGKENFEFVVLEELTNSTREELFELEQQYIDDLIPKFNGMRTVGAYSPKTQSVIKLTLAKEFLDERQTSYDKRIFEEDFETFETYCTEYGMIDEEEYKLLCKYLANELDIYDQYEPDEYIDVPLMDFCPSGCQYADYETGRCKKDKWLHYGSRRYCDFRPMDVSATHVFYKRTKI